MVKGAECNNHGICLGDGTCQCATERDEMENLYDENDNKNRMHATTTAKTRTIVQQTAAAVKAAVAQEPGRAQVT